MAVVVVGVVVVVPVVAVAFMVLVTLVLVVFRVVEVVLHILVFRPSWARRESHNHCPSDHLGVTIFSGNAPWGMGTKPRGSPFKLVVVIKLGHENISDG